MSIIEFSSENENNRSNIQIYSDSFSEDMGRGGVIEGRSELSFTRDLSTSRRIHVEDVDARFLKQMDHLACGLCKDILIDPVECSNCSTPFCRKCIQGWH